ncbi:MAG: translation initiation factor IF-1 [Terriglobia bacterium]|nr:MAG: translation initiation factor IF-1 [Terriglobia bacterium]
MSSGANVEATVVEERPNAVYELRSEKGHRVLASLAGNADRNFVKLAPGDRVEVELSPQDPTRGKVRRKI